MSPLVLAIGLGALSAVSLPLGALTARFWQPADRMLGILTAFGAGALLAAVTIGIVAPMLEVDQAGPLVAGAVIGGLAFEALNRGINARGGFLRKASTTLVYAEQRERRRRRRLLDHLERVEVFDGLPDRELDLLAAVGAIVEYPERRLIYGQGDPAEALHVIVRGRVRLDHPDGARELGEQAVFGFRSFLAGAPHRSSAVAMADPTEVLEIPRARFLEVLERADRLRDRLETYLTSETVLTYLAEEHGLTSRELDDWVARVRADDGHGTVRAREAPHPGRDFVARAARIRRIPVFAELPAEELVRIGDRLLRKEHAQGHSFFRPGDAPDRLYVLEAGQVSLVTQGGPHAGEQLRTDDAFGVLSFFTGAPHVATAVATTDVTVWVLRRADLPELLTDLPGFRAAVQRYLEQPDVRRYLREQQGAAPQQAELWARRAMRSVADARPAPEVRATTAERAAPMAIWLGLMLDGIPESFVIGAEATAAVGGSSLLVGLFLSNYPEALSSSVGMHEQGWGWRRILLLWSSLLVAAAVGAGIGALVFAGASPALSAAIRGIATGAMITVIAETMLPEAFARSGSASGLATLAGFLVTVLVGH
ncbi:MAG: cyclic nucleotide-binding domain-containing protein [Nitriliruptoraceae bacterium]